MGAWVRAERRRLGLRQADLASRAGVSAQTVVRVEQGRLPDMRLKVARSVAAGVGLRLAIVPSSVHGGSPERQIDGRHAGLVEAALRYLAENGWEARPEWSFNHFGDRGSVDVLGWHPRASVLLLVEVKSELRDVQATLRAMDVKRRVVPPTVAMEKGQPIAALGVVMVLADLRVERDRVDRHMATFAAALPARTVEIKRWVRDPHGPIRGVWFLQIPRQALPIQGSEARERVRRPRCLSAAISRPDGQRGQG